MPASIVHMLIAKECRDRLLTRDRYTDFSKILDLHKTYMELGSVGPDLPYYENAAMAVLNLLLDRSDKPMGVDQWSYQLHARNPNIFPLKMIEIAWSTFLRYAVDYDGDGRRDIWNNRADVLASIANFLAHLGWRDGESWGRRVVLPPGSTHVGPDSNAPTDR